MIFDVVLSSLYAVLSSFYAVLSSLYAVLSSLYAVLSSFYAVLASLYAFFIRPEFWRSCKCPMSAPPSELVSPYFSFNFRSFFTTRVHRFFQPLFQQASAKSTE